MKDIREIQYERTRALYQELTRSRNELVSADKIRTLSNEILYSTERGPMSGNYRVTAYENVDTDQLNGELGLCKTDSETLSEYFGLYRDRLRGLEFVSTVWQSMAKAKIARAMSSVITISSPVFIKGFTEEIDPSSVTDRDNTTLTVLDDGAITLMPVTSVPKKYTHRTRDISIQKIGSDSLVAEILGTSTSVMNIGENGGVVMTLTGKKVEEAGFIFEAKTNTEDVNQISLSIGEETRGIRIQVSISSNGTEYRSVCDQVVRKPKLDIPITTTDIRVIRVTMTMNAPNVVMLSEGRYEFRLYKISMVNVTRRNSGTWQSSEITLTSDIAHISLAVDDERAGDATIDYFVSIDKDAEGSAIGFINIDPYKAGSLVNLGNSTYTLKVQPDEADPRWKLIPEKKWGSKFYNILDVTGLTVESGDFDITDGAITFTSPDMSIIPDTIKLYRGYNDFLLKERVIELERSVDDISCNVDVSTTIEWVNAVPLRVRWRELIEDVYIYDSGDNYRNKIRVNWKIESPEDVQIERDDGKEVYAIVSDVKYMLSDSSLVGVREYQTSYSTEEVDATYITFTGMKEEVILDEDYHHYLTFVTNLSEYILNQEVEVELNLASFVVSVAGRELEQGVDYRVHPNMLKLELLKTGAYSQHMDLRIINNMVQSSTSPISMAYSFVETATRSTSYYETNIYVTVPTDIVILPFSAAEIAKGNFHIINNDDVSTLTYCTLNQGWNTVRTTNPYPSVNEYDTNVLTGVASSAGIVIPENIEKMRPYLDSMRQVSPFLLATLEPEEGAKCFSFVDNEIYVNFLPDFVEQDIISEAATAGTKGQVLLCKKPLLDPDYTNTGYTSQPEIFELEFAYVDETTEKFMFIRIEMESASSAYTAKVNRIGLNKYQEISS